MAVVAMSTAGLWPLGLAGAFAQSKASPVGAAQSTSAQAAAPTFDQVAKRAADARAASRFDEAIDDYRQAVRLKPGWIEGRFALGTLLYDQDKYPEALDEFRRVVQAQPKNGLVLSLKGLCELKVKNYERALNDLLAARELGIASPEVATVASFNAAALLNRYERYEQAYEILKDFALKDKDSQAVIEVFGLSVLRLPYLPGEAPPDKREMVLMAGRAAFHQARGRNTPLARQFFEELVSRYPTAPNVHYAFGVCLWVEDPQAALEEFRRELRSSPNHHHAMLQIAFEQLKQGQYAEALALSQRAVELAPNLFAARNALGRALLELGEVDRAVQELEMGARLAPDSPETFFSLARAYAKQGRAEDAARARATFLKLGAARRTARSGPESVGGMPPEAEAPLPEKN